MTPGMRVFLDGALTAMCSIAALFFARFWRDTRDRFFVFWTAAFSALALHWMWVGLLPRADDSRHYAYVLRLAAFLLILASIIDKNRGRR